MVDKLSAPKRKIVHYKASAYGSKGLHIFLYADIAVDLESWKEG